TSAPIKIDTSSERKEEYPKLQVDESVQVVEIASVHGGKIDSTSDNRTIRFTHRGYVDKTVIHFRNDSGDELSLMLSPFLGVTRVLEGYVALDEDRIMIER
ncbi:MAG: hypothetical protein D3924_15500, partial [Candidatus Electrothrix sp. AR4]|nr:hypothetical protein [Candidatus Electrothrix sp. AR4]